MAAKHPHRDTTRRLSCFANRRAYNHSAEYKYAEFVIRTRYGLVYIYTESDFPRSGNQYTEMEIIVDGIVHQRTWRKYWAHRTLVTLAKRFSHDVVCSEIPFGC